MTVHCSLFTVHCSLFTSALLFRLPSSSPVLFFCISLPDFLRFPADQPEGNTQHGKEEHLLGRLPEIFKIPCIEINKDEGYSEALRDRIIPLQTVINSPQCRQTEYYPPVKQLRLLHLPPLLQIAVIPENRKHPECDKEVQKSENVS